MSEQTKWKGNGTFFQREPSVQERPSAQAGPNQYTQGQTQTDPEVVPGNAEHPVDGETPFPWRRLLDVTSWGVAMFTLVHQLMQHSAPPQKAIVLSIMLGLAVKLGGELLGFIWRWLWALLATGGVVGVCAAGVVLSNPHCLQPVTAGDEEEQAICFYLSTFAPSLSPVLDVTTDLSLPEGHGLLLQSTQLPVQLAGAFSLPSLFGSATVLAQPSQPESPVNFSPSDRERFNTCIRSLYEDPALKLEAWLIRQKHLAAEVAHDVIMNKLMGVCQLYMQHQIDDLPPYYARAVRNAYIQERRGFRRHVSCERLVEMPQTCLREPLLLMNGESMAFERALCNLKVEQRALMDRWMQGGSWKEIGLDLGMSESRAANRFNSAIRSIQSYIESQTCQTRFR